ncbi:MAG TPA: hypothetical protein V6D06_06220 [Trichocoleus sp.]
MKFSIASTQNRPYPLVTAAETNGAGRQSKCCPQLFARWTVAQDGKLICCWTAV